MGEDQLNKLRDLNRTAQFYWDWVMVENSDGAHNSALAQDTLNKSEAAVIKLWHRSKRNATGLSAALEKGRPSAFPSRRIAPKLGRNGRASHEIGGQNG